MEQIKNLVYYDNNSDKDDENDDNPFHNIIQAEVVIEEEANDADDNVHGEPINSKFLHLIDE